MLPRLQLGHYAASGTSAGLPHCSRELPTQQRHQGGFIAFTSRTKRSIHSVYPPAPAAAPPCASFSRIDAGRHGKHNRFPQHGLPHCAALWRLAIEWWHEGDFLGNMNIESSSLGHPNLMFLSFSLPSCPASLAETSKPQRLPLQGVALEGAGPHERKFFPAPIGTLQVFDVS